jgi:uncharacterized membrane protein
MEQAGVPSRFERPTGGMVTMTHVLYGLHGFSALMGLLGPMLIVTAFLTGWPSLIAVIINYVQRSEVSGTWLDSHFAWQIRTFWYALLWVIVSAVLFVTVIGIPFAWALAVITGFWVLYRILRGWIALLDAKPMPMPPAAPVERP